MSSQFKRQHRWLLGALLCASSLAAHALTLDEALATAEALAPELAARNAAERAAQNLTRSAGALPDPKLKVGLDDLPLDGADRLKPTTAMRTIGLMQEFPNSDKRQAERQLAQAQWLESQAHVHAERLSIRRETTLAWLSLYFAAQRTVLLNEQEAENRTALAATKAQLAGGGNATDALAAQLESAQLADARDELIRDQAKARAMLARWLGTAAQQPVSGGLPDWLGAGTHTQIDDQPALHAAGAQADAARANLAMAQATLKPDWGVELKFKRDGMGQQLGMVEFSFDLPVFTRNRQDPRIAAALDEVEQREAERNARRAEYQQQLDELHADQAALQAQLTRLNLTVLPLAARQLDVALAGYRAGKGSLADVLNARKALLSGRLRVIDLNAQIAAVATRLYYPTGAH
ncbi:Outer membrane protein TolC [Andreprevotia lacus DSM 23236]|jgi:outer membrane protein TolC|uniref:Outer membrane protein TolC n=1 Tax=Andreprevotia lacus DSM 23236 TaxID=1121001 RepID=A0A1W1XZS8_9NEIS|nr:TolC family protein [Andreprevotia lacus]SMC29392.1 Outer membrane protein TolC [Andreprevotia lacus DSM 23236]